VSTTSLEGRSSDSDVDRKVISTNLNQILFSTYSYVGNQNRHTGNHLEHRRAFFSKPAYSGHNVPSGLLDTEYLFFIILFKVMSVSSSVCIASKDTMLSE
jgi:hypothetical protein